MSKTTPQTVHEAHTAAFTGTMNMIECAAHCGMTLKQFKMTFREFLKYNEPSYRIDPTEQLSLF